MKLWLIYQSAERGYDTYDSAVVAAETEQQARETHPGGLKWDEAKYAFLYSDGETPFGHDWASNPSLVTAELIGDAIPGTEAGVICASFNAG